MPRMSMDGRIDLRHLEDRALGPIDRIDLLTVRLPFVSPFGTSVHTWTCKEALLLRVASGECVGWGECVADPDPYYASETTATARHLIRDFLLPELRTGKDVDPGTEMTLGGLLARFRRVRGHAMAKATVENALLDLLAKRDGLPLHALLGWPRRRIPSGISIGLKETPEELVAAVDDAVRRGYHRVKIKIARGRDVPWVRAVRDRFPAIALMVDANGDYSLDDAAHLAQLDAFDLMMIEQPLSYSDIVRHAELQARLRTPLCLDESIHGLDDALAALDLRACRILNIKQGRVGGILESIRIATACAARGIPTWSGGMDETGIGRAFNLHLQTVDGFTLPGDTSETSRYFDQDLVDPPVVLDPEGFIEVPPAPGIGVAVLDERLARFLIDSERLR